VPAPLRPKVQPQLDRLHNEALRHAKSLMPMNIRPICGALLHRIDRTLRTRRQIAASRFQL
jgi:hypothetical protein